MLKNDSIFKKYLMFFILCGFLPIVISSCIMFRLYEKNTLNNTMMDIDYIFNYLSGSIENVAEDMRRLSSYIIEESRNTGLMDNLIAKRSNADDIEARRQMIDRIIEDTISMNHYVKGAVFIGRDNEFQGASRISGIFNENYKPVYNAKIQNYISGKLTDNFIPTWRAPYYNDETEVITIVNAFTYTDEFTGSTEILGVMFVDVYIDSIGIFFNNLDKEMMSIIYLSDLDGSCIYSLNSAWIGRKIYEFQTHQLEGYSKMGNREFYFKTHKIPSSSWSLVAGIDKGYLLSKITIVKYWTFAIIALGILICLALAFLGSKTFSKPIGKILKSMHEAENGNLDVRVSMESADEIGQIADSFDAMLEQMQEYIQKEYVLRLKQREAELTALKTQIRPHFLYNTLEVIRIEAMNSGSGTVAEMIQALADQFRYITDNETDNVPVRVELEIIKKYFNIIDIRYSGKIKHDINVSPAVQDIKIPKLSIQTLVENAVIHGLKIKGGKVCINGCIKNGVCTIDIIDNGVGITKSRLAEINNALKYDDCTISKQDISSGIGLENVSERLCAYYGAKSSMTIESIEGIGTSVKIVIKSEN